MNIKNKEIINGDCLEIWNYKKDKDVYSSIGRPTFSSAYFCADFLPKQIIEKLEL